MNFWNFAEKHPTFQHPSGKASFDDFRRLTSARMYTLLENRLVRIEDAVEDPRIVSTPQ